MNPTIPSALLQFTFRPEANILICRWSYQPEVVELPPAYDKLAEVAQRENCLFWLQDIRRRSSNDPNTTQWLLTDYFPTMAQRLGGRLCVAYLVSPTLHQEIMKSSGFQNLIDYEGSFAVGFFGDEGEATQWLEAHQSGRA